MTTIPVRSLPEKISPRMTAMMVEDFIHDPILAAKVILGLDIPPHQQLRILQMWTTHYMQDDSGFSMGKSTTCAIVIILRSILFPGRISGIVSGTFRQGKLIFANFDRWYNSSIIFRHCVKHERGQKRIIHGSEAFEIYFRGGSSARALPPNFVQNSTRLQSERWNDGYFDEWTIFNMRSLTKTLIGRVTAVNPFQDDPIRQNHIFLCGTPGFMHDPAYAIVRKVQRNVAEGNRDYFQFTCNYRHIPKTKRWKGFVDRKAIFTMQTMNPIGIVKSEVDGVWQKDSQSFYPSSGVDAARLQSISVIKERSNDDEIFIAAFDTARGGSDDRSNSGKADDFSLTVTRPIHGRLVHVNTVRKNSVTAEQMASIVYDGHLRYHFSLIGYDPGGGGLFVRDELRKNAITIGDVMVPITPIVEPTDNTGVIGQPILVPFKRGFLFADQMWGKVPSDSIIINRLHREVSSAISSGNFILSPKWDGWDEVGKSWDADAKREWLNTHPGITEENRQRAEMDLAICQLVMVDIERDRQSGKPILDKWSMFKFGSKAKKDSAYSLIYAYYTYLVWKYITEAGLSMGDGGEDSESAVSTGAVSLF